MRTAILILCLGGLPAHAQDWNIRPWDAMMDRQEVQDRIRGRAILFMDGGVATYRDDGSYSYTYQGGREFTGAYQIRPDGAVCVDFDAGQTRCDLYVRHDERLVMIAETGRRFPTSVEQ